MQNAELVERLHKIYACNYAIKWIKQGNLDLKSAWYWCDNFSWLIWFIDAIELNYIESEDIEDFKSHYNLAEIESQLILISDKTYKEKDL